MVHFQIQYGSSEAEYPRPTKTLDGAAEAFVPAHKKLQVAEEIPEAEDPLPSKPLRRDAEVFVPAHKALHAAEEIPEPGDPEPFDELSGLIDLIHAMYKASKSFEKLRLIVETIKSEIESRGHSERELYNEKIGRIHKRHKGKLRKAVFTIGKDPFDEVRQLWEMFESERNVESQNLILLKLLETLAKKMNF